MAQQDRPLIVGAGPTGKGAALFLARAGIVTRVIDVAPEPSLQSRALAVNPRSLQILESTGVTDQMLAVGLRIRGARIRYGRETVAEFVFERLHHKYPFMLALSQAVTERLLGEELIKLGGSVERGVGLVSCRSTDDGVAAELQYHATGEIESATCPWLLGADGAHSTTRRALDVGFPGSTFDAPWYLADLPLTTSLESDWAHAFIRRKGFVFVIRVVDEASPAASKEPLWRVISNRPNPAEQLIDAAPAGPPVWESDFHIAHRMVEHMQVGNVYFAGDAAHLHSPIGARGMNLGLEDAWVFAQLATSGRLDRYAKLRERTDGRIVRRIELFSRMVLGESAVLRAVRALVFRFARVPFVRNQFLHTATGLDHPLTVS